MHTLSTLQPLYSAFLFRTPRIFSGDWQDPVSLETTFVNLLLVGGGSVTLAGEPTQTLEEEPILQDWCARVVVLKPGPSRMETEPVQL